MWLFAIFIIVPLIEIALFIQVGGWLTLWPTLGIVLLTAIVGSALLRWQGTQVLRDLQHEIGSLGNPLSPLAHGALILIGGVMMILPGFFTDVLGILLMVPPIRRLVIHLILSRVPVTSVSGFGYSRGAQRDPNTLDGDFVEVHPKDDA